jgi:hypothetical protein
MDSGILALPRKLDIWNTDTVFLTRTAQATPNYGVLNIGDAPFDGLSAAKFVGGAAGTGLAMNFASGFTGNLIDAQVAGVGKLKLDATGNATITSAGTGAVTVLTVAAAPGSGANATNVLVQNTSSGTRRAQILFGGSATSSQWIIGNDFDGNDSQALYVWDRAAVAMRLFINSSGNFVVGNAVGSSTPTAGAVLDVRNGTSGTVGVVINGASGQTADLQRWQDSSGNVLGQFTAGGQIRAVRSGTPAQYVYMYHDGVGHVRCVGSQVTFDDGIATGVVIGSTGSGPANVVATIKGATSQSTDLQQWQNSVGFVLKKIDKAGYTTTTGGITITPALPPAGVTVAAGAGGPGANLAASTTYFYTLTAVDYEGKESAGNTVGSIAEGATPTQVNLSWTTPAGSVQFINIYKGTVNNTSSLFFLAQVAGSATSYTDTGNVATTGQTPPTGSQTGCLTVQTTSGPATTWGNAPPAIQINDINGNPALNFGPMYVSGSGGWGIATTSRMHINGGSAGVNISAGTTGGILGITGPSGVTVLMAVGGSGSTLQLQNGPSQQVTVIPTSSASSGTFIPFTINPTMTQTSTAGYTALLVNVVESSTGSGTKRLFDVQVGGASKFNVDNAGNVTAQGQLNDGVGTGAGSRLDNFYSFT